MLVPGDIVRLAAGDMVPADVRVLSAKDLFVNQAALTGEALPVEKKPSRRPQTFRTLWNCPTSASWAPTWERIGDAVVIHTGSRTYFDHWPSVLSHSAS